MKITTVALLAAIALPTTTFAASPGSEGASGSIAGVNDDASSSITSQDSNRGAASSTDESHNTTNIPSLQKGPSTTGAGDSTSDMSGSGGANTGQKTTTTPKNAGPREPGDMTGGSPAR